jgi:hypothetical protein
MTKNKEKIIIKESKTYPGLFVKKYARHVFFDSTWDADTIEARGHVVDKDGNVVIRPFTKIFNRHEPGIDGVPTDIDRDEMVVAIRKVNGFMAAATYVPAYDEVIVSTTGSLDSDFVAMAKEMISEEFLHQVKEKYPHTTFMFEIVHPNDPHVVPEATGAYLLGARAVGFSNPYMSFAQHEIALDRIADLGGVLRPEWKECRFGDLVKEMTSCRHEGYCVYSKDKALKMKSAYYLTTKFLGRLSNAKMVKMATDPLQFKKDVDEEYFPVCDYIAGNKEHFLSLDEQGRMKFIRDFLTIQATI